MSDPFASRPSSVSIEVQDVDAGAKAPSRKRSPRVSPSGSPLTASFPSSSLSLPPVSSGSLSGLAYTFGTSSGSGSSSRPGTAGEGSSSKNVEASPSPSSPRISATDLAAATAFAATKKAHFSIGAHSPSLSSLAGAYLNGASSPTTGPSSPIASHSSSYSSIAGGNLVQSYGRPSTASLKASPLRQDPDSAGSSSVNLRDATSSANVRDSIATITAAGITNNVARESTFSNVNLGDSTATGIRDSTMNQRKGTSRMKSHLLDYTLTDRNNPPPMTYSDGTVVKQPNFLHRFIKSIFSSSSPATSSFPYTPIRKIWLEKQNRSKRAIFSYYIVWLMFFIGIGLGLVQSILNMRSTTAQMLIAPNDGPYGPIGAFFRSSGAIAYPEKTASGFAEGIAAGKYLGASQSGTAHLPLSPVFSSGKSKAQPLCLTFDETWSDPVASFGTRDPTTGLWEGGRWLRETSMNGFGTGEFEMTTSEETNSFIEGNQLFIAPTLTPLSEAELMDGTLYNVTGCTFNLTEGVQAAVTGGTVNPDGSITGGTLSEAYLNACSAVSNSTTGTMINPVQSARISTRLSKNIRYGMIEIRAKMPRGDWMWPAIWMLPTPEQQLDGATPQTLTSTDGYYGEWPRSGEIDLVESRGNGIEYTARGRNYVQASLNWGPTSALNSVAKSYSFWSDKRTGFDQGFHTYRLEWTPTFLRVSIDTRLHTLINFPFKEDFFTRGDYPTTFTNDSTGAIQQLTNPWSNSTEGGEKSAPFDRPFYLIMNLAVGSRTGWFPEGQGNKPWLDGSSSAMQSWWDARNDWLPTWPGFTANNGDIRDSAMVVDYVKMWEMC